MTDPTNNRFYREKLMTDLTQQIARLEKLDAERTQGQWGYDGEDTVASEDWGGRGYTVFPVDSNGTCCGFIADCDLNEDDAQFIAAAPEMMTVIREQQRLLGLAVEGLGDIAYMKSWNVNNRPMDMVCIAIKTLAELKPTEEV